VTCPPSGLYEGLIDSGLIPRSTALPKRPPQTPLLNIRPPRRDLRRPTLPNKLTKLRQNTDRFHFLFPPHRSRVFSDLAEMPSRETPPSPQFHHREVTLDPHDFFNQLQHNRQRGSSGPKEAKALLRELDLLSSSLSPEDFHNDTMPLFTGKFAAYLLVWNELTLQLRASNEVHALLCHRLKKYAHLLFGQLPDVIRQYEVQIENLQRSILEDEARIEDLTTTSSSLEEQAVELAVEVEQLTKNVAAKAISEREFRAEITDLTYRLDDQKVRTDDLLFHCGKNDELIHSIQAEVSQKDGMIESLNTQLAGQQDLIQRYKTEEAGFRPKYIKTIAELEALTENHKEVLAEIAVLKIVKDTQDIGTDPIPLIASGRHTRGGLKPIGSKKVPIKPRSFEDHPTPDPLGPPPPDAKGALSGASSVSSISENSPHSPLPSGRISDINGVLNPLDISESLEEESQTNSILEEQSSNKNVCLLPPDYVFHENMFDDYIEASPAYVTYVDRLFPLPRIDGVARANFGSSEVSGEIKSLSWTLRQIVMICRNSFEVDSLTVLRTDFMELLTEVLKKSGKNEAIVEKLKANLLRSLIHWRENSFGVQFFFMFVTGEYTIPDFRFVNMLFSLCFEALYPPLDRFLIQSNLTDDFGGFLIHRHFFDKISGILLRIHPFPCNHLELVLNELPPRQYADLIPFWLFAREMINLFKDIHIRFHKQIRNIFQLVGGTDHDNVDRQTFPDFVRIVKPDIRESKIRDMWQTMILFDIGIDRPSIPIQVFVKFCGEYPGMSRSIEELPFLEDFNQTFQRMNGPMVTFFTFLRNRLTHFLPSFIIDCPADIHDAIMPYVRKMRNGFLLCDISTCNMCYRYIMQYLDLKLTQQNPFQIINTGITIEDVEKMISHTMMRETLASLLLKIQFGNESDESEQKNTKG
jgi:hypothetical protein